MHPILISIFGVPLYSYGFLLGIACVLGVHLGVHFAEQRGVEGRKAFVFFSILIVAGLVGSRVHELLANEEYKGKFAESLVQLRSGGRTAYGGFLGAMVAWMALSRVFKVPFWTMGDAAAPTLGMGLGIARIGCFLFGCDYGVRTDSALGVCFPAGSPAWGDQIQDGLIAHDATASLPVFPAQILSSIDGWILFGLCLLVMKKKKREGSVVLFFFGAYGIVRAFEERLRADHGRGELFGVSQSTAIGIISAAVALAFLLVPWLAKLRPPAIPVMPVNATDKPAEKPAA